MRLSGWLGVRPGSRSPGRLALVAPTRGAAARTAASTWSANLAKLSMNRVDQLRRGRVIFGLVGPGVARVEDRAVDARHADRHLEAEIRVVAELDIVEAAVERGVEQSAGRLDRHAAADAIFAAGPAGVDQPAVDAALGDPLLEQIAVDARVARHERRAEAGREGRLGLGHADLGAGDLGGVAGEEMVHGLVGRQPRDRRQHAEGVGGEDDDVLRHRPHILGRAVGDEVDRIGAAGILGERGCRRGRARASPGRSRHFRARCRSASWSRRSPARPRRDRRIILA